MVPLDMNRNDWYELRQQVLSGASPIFVLIELSKDAPTFNTNQSVIYDNDD